MSPGTHLHTSASCDSPIRIMSHETTGTVTFIRPPRDTWLPGKLSSGGAALVVIDKLVLHQEAPQGTLMALPSRQ